MHALFKPNLTPKEIIWMGSFGGTYFDRTERNIDIDFKEFPEDWFRGIPEELYCSKK